jgi:hypothetical protein
VTRLSWFLRLWLSGSPTSPSHRHTAVQVGTAPSRTDHVVTNVVTDKTQERNFSERLGRVVRSQVSPYSDGLAVDRRCLSAREVKLTAFCEVKLTAF